MMKFRFLLPLLFILPIAFQCYAVPEYPPVVLPDSVAQKNIVLWSDGRALDGYIFRPKNLHPNQKRPAIITSHGWGGDKNTAARYAAKFADSGFIVLTFTHSTWGNSQGNIKTKNTSDGTVYEAARNLVDPIDWIQNLRSAVDYIEGEPNVDNQRIGAWGTSFGGGIIVANAAKDNRIKAIVTQVAAFPALTAAQATHAKRRAVQIARGDVPAVPEDLDKLPGLTGSPHLARFLQYHPMRDVTAVTVPTLLIAAGNETLFKNQENSEKAYGILRAKVGIETEYYVIDNIDHYGIYFDGYDTGSSLALNWFKKHLQ